MEKTPDQSIITVRVSSRSETQPSKEYSLAIQGYHNFFREFPREEIRVLFYDSLRQPTDTFHIEITNEEGRTLCAVVYNQDIELSDFFNMVEATVSDYNGHNNLVTLKSAEERNWEDDIPF